MDWGSYDLGWREGATWAQRTTYLDFLRLVYIASACAEVLYDGVFTSWWDARCHMAGDIATATLHTLRDAGCKVARSILDGK